ncbi:hypothetical protein ACOMHN_024027 [Nucella lapillus]
MGLKWTTAFLFCSLVLGSVFGQTVIDCASGKDACASANIKGSYGDGTFLCCPDGYTIKTSVSTVNGVTTKSCTCTQSSGNAQVNAINKDVQNNLQKANQSLYQMIQALLNRLRTLGH